MSRPKNFCIHSVLHWASVSESASRCSSVSMGWHRTTCLLCATLYPDSLDDRTFALRIADSSTSHALHCRRAVFEPSRMLVHLCGTLCPFIARTAIWLLQLSCAILSLISFLSTDFVSSGLECDHINALYKFTIITYLPTYLLTYLPSLKFVDRLVPKIRLIFDHGVKRPRDLVLWPFDLWVKSLATCVISFLRPDFQLATPFQTRRSVPTISGRG